MLARFSEWLYQRTHPSVVVPSQIQVLATLWPGFDHFNEFASNERLSGVRINPAMITPDQLSHELSGLDVPGADVPLWYDVKGRQLRVVESERVGDHIELVMNHPLSLSLNDESSRTVLLKAGGDIARIERVTQGGRRIVLSEGRQYGPRWRVSAGESIHIRNPTLRVHGPLFTQEELGKIETAKRAGFTRWFLSYVESARDVELLRDVIGKDQEIWLKIESPAGLEYVARDFHKEDGLVLTAARGDLYVEMERPHQITQALKLIVNRDPEACVGSRILLSVVQRPMPPAHKERALQAIYERANWRDADMAAVGELIAQVFHDPVPSCADFSELAWLMDIGFRRFLLCDELCLDGVLLDTAIEALHAFAGDHLQAA